MTRHIPVMLSEVIELLGLHEDANVIDCTLGDAGHSEAMLEKIGPHGRLLGIDADPESVLRAKQYLYRFGDRATFVRDNFENITKIAGENQFAGADAILADLGWSTPQFAERGRGFSFEKDEPLDMRYGGTNGRSHTAAEVVNEYGPEDLKRIFRQYGEEKLYSQIAEKIVEERKKTPIDTTKKLNEVILSVYRKVLNSDKEIPWVGGLHPATKIYQALRIEVNNEFEVLKRFLPEAIELLVPGGRLAIITFHSAEDRIVKHAMQGSKKVRLVTKKPLIAKDDEVSANPSARSAKLRVVEKI